MRCPVCDRTVEPGQRFCTGCGTSLKGVTDDPAVTSTIPKQTPPEQAGTAPATPPPAAAPQPGDDDWDDPVWAATGEMPTTPGTLPPPPPPLTDQLPRTQPTTATLPATEPIDRQPEPTPTAIPRPPLPDDTPGSSDIVTPYDAPYDYVENADPTVVQGPITDRFGASPATEVIGAYVPPPERARFRFNAVLVLGLVAGGLALASLFTTVLSIEPSRQLVIGSDAPAGFRTGIWILDDLADNLSIAGLLAAAAMVVGGVASAFGWKWGGGLAGGGGLGFAGVAAIAIGLAQMPIDAAHEYARLPADPPFTLTITRDAGYYLLLAAAAAGIVLFFASFNDLANDRRPGLNPWIAALGGLAVVVAAAGPLLPENLAVFSDNWYLVEGPGEPPAMLLAGRAIQLTLLVVAGVVGFLCVRRFGIGLALGGSLPVMWMAASVLFELTDRPVGPAYRNPGSTEMDLHGVTVIGVAALASMLLLAIVAAYDQGVRERL
jgi:hypothetical protein